MCVLSFSSCVCSLFGLCAVPVGEVECRGVLVVVVVDDLHVILHSLRRHRLQALGLTPHTREQQDTNTRVSGEDSNQGMQTRRLPFNSALSYTYKNSSFSVSAYTRNMKRAAYLVLDDKVDAEDGVDGEDLVQAGQLLVHRHQPVVRVDAEAWAAGQQRGINKKRQQQGHVVRTGRGIEGAQGMGGRV